MQNGAQTLEKKIAFIYNVIVEKIEGFSFLGIIFF